MSKPAVRSLSDDEWQAVLRQLREQPPARPRPYFYGRVMARLAGPPARPAALGWLRRPAYAVLLGALVLALSGDDKALNAPAPVPGAATARPLP
ncbi:hypothetical protein MUN81_18200 [Hymenobacter sp. 5317J-9]|uniref:hypothetical protein n=1 Tax=Hymenobacter sp. 5317J-9 TaxID=2932250 RepID=UPI001FD69ECC|nr:hypothetical protein [Hymenobacter sp. 5317J-9]UOQ97159.1 hypothetical protein MUN81_18200 [Hymenobacter sp. 5317J-9]